MAHGGKTAFVIGVLAALASGTHAAHGAGGGGAVTAAGDYSHTRLMRLWRSAGGSAATAGNAACHAAQESSGDRLVTSPNPDGGTNVGLWQLDTRGAGAGYSVAQLQNAALNARISVRATHNGTDWSQWATPGC